MRIQSLSTIKKRQKKSYISTIGDRPRSSIPAMSSTTSCAICLDDDLSAASRAPLMPCCGVAGSSIAYCRRCLEIICERSAGGVGRCPTCSGSIAIDAATRDVIVPIVRRGQCQMCRQSNPLVGTSLLCDACTFGCGNPLRYECDACHNVQRIPHPMYRYQPLPEAFSTATWACHQRCGRQTHWRISPSDVHGVPDADCPAGWGRRDAWLAAVRAQRHREMQAGDVSEVAQRWCSLS